MFLTLEEDPVGDNRCFYMQPQNPFLEEPRVQNQYRNKFVREVGHPAGAEPLTLMADDLHKSYIESITDKSNPDSVKQDLCKFFKRRQYLLQHKRYKLQLRWAHYALTSEAADAITIKLNPYYSKVQFELENAVKRHQRLEGVDHFLTAERPQQEEGSSYADSSERPPLSALRADDIDVYLRLTTYEDKITKNATRFIQRAKWVQFSHRWTIYEESIQYFQDVRERSIQSQRDYVQKVKDKGQSLIDNQKLGDLAEKELAQIVQSKLVSKQAARIEEKTKKDQYFQVKEKYLARARYNYELPPLVYWNEVELKLQLQALAEKFLPDQAKRDGDMEKDSGHTFSYSVMVSFPQHFQQQVILNQFAPYDALPSMIDPANLAKKNIKKVLRRNQKKYGRTQGANTLLEKIEIEKHQKEMGVEFLNSIEKALFGEFNNAQYPDFPTVRIKKSDWIELVCFKAKLGNDQMHQAAILGSDKNWIDECLANMLETLNVQDVQNVNLILESLSQLHFDKVKYGSVKTDFLNFDASDSDTFFTEDQKQFISLFKACFKAKSENDTKSSSGEVRTDSLHEIPQHLLFANYLLQCLNAREQKTKLLYTLNTFRAVQRRLTIELREMGTRDRVLGDAQLVMPMELRGANNVVSTDDDDSNEATTPVDQVGADASGDVPTEQIDLINDPLLDINKYRFNKRVQNYLHTTCPIVPKFHSTFGQPIERQEISQEIDNGRNTDAHKQENKKLVGRVDQIYKHSKTGINLVKDDFGIHVLYDSAFADMRSMETELLKLCSFYINKAEPLLDNDLRNIFPVVDRLKILDEALGYENQYQEAKLQLVLAYQECYEHSSDILEQQRLIQAIVDEMAKRPRFNLSGTHFKDSYLAEVECLEGKTKLVREVITMLMTAEKEENNHVREYIEKAYRLLYDNIQKKWSYIPPESKESEMNQRQLISTKEAGNRDSKNDKLQPTSDKRRRVDETELLIRQQEIIQQVAMKESYTFTSLQDFASKLEIPMKSLDLMMKDHHERDHLVRQSVHEHTAFIKLCEGYPQFMSRNSVIHNKFKFSDKSETIGILDFFESLQIMPKILASIERVVNELEQVHKPDNGLLTTSLEISTINFLTAELKLVKDGNTGVFERPKGINNIEDNHVIGNPDKMLFFTKELAASGNDKRSAHNPFVIGKLDVPQVQKFDFTPFMGYIDSGAQIKPEQEAKLAADIESQPIQQKNFGKLYARLGERTGGLQIPNMLFLCCNSVEVLRLRHQLLNCIEQTQVLEDVYKSQAKVLGKECKVNFKEQMNIASFFNGGEHFVNFVEEGPGTDLDIKLAINEFDKQLRSAINFSDPECFKALILPLGLEELRSVVAYEVMNLQILIVAVRTNQVQMDNTQRKLCEIGFFRQGFCVANPVLPLYSLLYTPGNAHEQKLAKLPQQCKQAAEGYLSASVSKGYYNIIERKAPMKETVEKTFKAVKHSLQAEKDVKHEVVAKKLRALKIVMCHDYCQDVLARTYNDSIRLQILQTTDTLRKRIYLLPGEEKILELGLPTGGEHQFAAYNEEETKPTGGSDLFYNQEDNRIQSFWRLPTNSEVLNLEANQDQFKAVNMSANLNFDLVGGQANVDEEGMVIPRTGLTPQDFAGENQLEMIQARIPKITLTESRDVDAVVKERQRLVEFQQGYDYDSPSKLIKFLRYWKSVGNILDLEFFINKLGSTAFAMANVEKMVLSGVPFYEDGEEALMAGSDSGDSEEEVDTPKKGGDVNKFDDGGHKPLKNVLAGQVAEKIAREKREKNQLIQDLESVRDKFTEYGAIMKKQEMKSNLARAETFLSEIHQIVFYGILFTLYQLQDNYLKEKKGQKEIQELNDLIENLSHQIDLKVTYLNGFHVNYAITALDRLNIDSCTFNPDYDSFFKATQPIIDEAALNPPEFNLVQGIYLTNSINLVTFKKNLPYMGSVFLQDYKCLDYALTNISKDIRKYLMNNLVSIEVTLQDFTKIKMQLKKGESEKDYQSNPSIYSQIMQEKKSFLRAQIKARQLRRVYMMIKNKRTISLDLDEYSEMHQQYNDDLHWKIMLHLDEIANTRLAVHQREEAAKRRNQRGNEANQIQKAIKAPAETPASKSYDHAMSEIHVVQSELEKYMIKISFTMFQSETDALAKTFEMTDIRKQIFIHPAQQFASTFHTNIDNRNHLDIINKVGPIQKMLTQIKNRCLEIETLTSGTGIVISSKDLNECLEECCRSLIKYGEIEMRTRCESLSTNLIQYENLIYIKDRQLLNLENKLRTAKVELNKIINTKVFSRGNNLIYELDMTNRQLRLMKDNVFLLEKSLTEKIKLCYDRELDMTKMKLEQKKQDFKDYEQNVTAQIKKEVREKNNTIDGVMKQTATRYQNLEKDTQRQQAFKGSSYSNVNTTTINIENVIIGKDGTVTQPGGQDPELIAQNEELKYNEKEARDETMRLMDIIRKYRYWNKLKEVLQAEKHEFQIDNLKQQLTSNTTLWEQLAESEKREKILKQEVERAQQEIATQEKIIERLKDDIKKEGREKQKLLQFQSTKSRRLDALESKAREFEVLSSVNLSKILGLLESKEQKIEQLTASDQNSNGVIAAIKRLNDKEINQVRKQAQEETKYKIDAMTKLEGLRQELQTIQGSEQTNQQTGFWKEQCQNLFDICKNLKQDNEKLVTQVGFEQPMHSQSMNNPDLVHFINQQQRQGNSSHARNNSLQANTLPRNNYDLAYGMNQNLQDHLMGKQRNRGNSSINSFNTEQKDHMDSGRFGIQKTQIGRNLGVGESIVMGGNMNGNMFNPAQVSPFQQQEMLQGKMTPMYEAQQKMLLQKQGGIFGPGGGGQNVFQSLNEQNSLQSSNGKMKYDSVQSIDRTTQNTGNISAQRGSGAYPHYQSKHDPNVSTDLAGNIFNFAPQTQRMAINLDGQEDPHQDSLNQPINSTRIPLPQSNINQFGEIVQNSIPSVATEGQEQLQEATLSQITPQHQKKGGEAKLVTQLQPKLINPPSKLVKTLDPKGVKASYVKRKQHPSGTKELNQF